MAGGSRRPPTKDNPCLEPQLPLENGFYCLAGTPSVEFCGPQECSVDLSRVGGQVQSSLWDIS